MRWASPDFIHLERIVPYCFFSHNIIRPLLHALKYYDRLDIAYDLGRLLALEWKASGQCPQFDALIPVPLHWFKYLKRGYNQSERIASGMAKELGVPVVQGLRRTRYAKSQTRKRDHSQRWTNVRNAFAIRERFAPSLAGKHVLLIDDVITTGATTSGCIAALLPIPEIRISLASIAAPYKLCAQKLSEEDLVALLGKA